MSLIKVLLPYFRRIAKSTKFTPEDVTSIHPVFYYQVPRVTVEGQKEIEEVYFYKPIGSFVYCIHVLSNELPENTTMIDLKREFIAIEVRQPLYHYHIESTGRIFP